MGLFDKKYCDICGEKIKLLGNRKLEDGNLCKDCASKLSPWFSERRSSTVQDIRDQLAYREENKAKAEAFKPTRTFGESYMVYLDEDAGTFCVARSGELRSGNPDILKITQVTGCDLDIEETKTEVRHKDAEGRQVSYEPKRYDYRYDFYMDLRVTHPWFDSMRFRLNPSSVEIACGSNMPPSPPPADGKRPGPGAVIGRALRSNAFDPASNAEYQRYVAMGNEIREAVMQSRQEAREEIAEASAPKKAVICPACGASTIPDANGCCEFCGSALPA